MFTIVFLSFHSGTHIKRLISSIEKKYPIIVIENSLDVELKNELEGKYDNVKVIIPSKNIGISAGYNLGIRESRTNFVKLTSADIYLTNKCLEDLEDCISKIKNFAILGPTYDDETIYKNYRIWKPGKITTSFTDKVFEEYKVTEVDFVENDFVISKKDFKDLGFFDENIFMYYETMDLCKKVRTANKKIYICKKIKFTHYGASSVNLKFSDQYSLNRSWHYNWSKFYYFKKNFGYFFAIRKIYPNFLRSIKKMIICKIYRKKKEYLSHKNELLGILTSIFNRSSTYRPFEIE
jgi:GT2 family glycosyltransferase